MRFGKNFLLFIAQDLDIINNKERFEDWEIDTIVGKQNKGAILTVVERTTGFPLMKKLKKGKNAKNLVKEICLMMLSYKNGVLSIASDNGTEFYEHKWIAKKLETAYFFADPYASCQIGLNEYTNGLARQHIPKNQTLEILMTKLLQIYNIKLTVDQEKNLTLKILKKNLSKNCICKLNLRSDNL